VKRSWHWHAGEDPVLGKVDKTITLVMGGLSYTGWSDNPGFGGGYTIGFQTVAESP